MGIFPIFYTHCFLIGYSFIKILRDGLHLLFLIPFIFSFIIFYVDIAFFFGLKINNEDCWESGVIIFKSYLFLRPLIILYKINYIIFLIYFFNYLWITQIIYNIIYNNECIYPLFFSLSNILNMLFFIFIFNDNLSFLFPPFIAFILAICLMVFNIILLYLQSIFGARFMLPPKCREKRISFYKTKKELLKEKNAIKENCIICFAPLLLITNFNSKINFSNNNKSSESDVINSENNINIEIKEENKTDKINYLNSILINIKNIFKTGFFNYYIYNDNKLKPYILLSCNHCFHAKCIEIWLEKKRECPICRKVVINLDQNI